MPESIKVGPHVYEVVRKTPNGDHGLCNPAALQIGVKRGLKRSLAQDALLHETLHACVPTSLSEKNHSEEDFVTGITASLLGVLQDNPELLEYLTQ